MKQQYESPSIMLFEFTPECAFASGLKNMQDNNVFEEPLDE